jgi:hypothetical protein
LGGCGCGVFDSRELIRAVDLVFSFTSDDSAGLIGGTLAAVFGIIDWPAITPADPFAAPSYYFVLPPPLQAWRKELVDRLSVGEPT